jgi:hypothetical protein
MLRLVEVGGDPPQLVLECDTQDELRGYGAWLYAEVTLHKRTTTGTDPYALARIEHPTVQFSAEDGLRRVIRNAGVYSPLRRARWSHVAAVLGHGSGVSQALCRNCGVDPD